LRDVAAIVAEGGLRPQRLLGERLLLWFETPGAERGGRGALCDPRALAASLPGQAIADLPPVPGQALQSFGARQPAGGEEIVPELWWVTPRAAAKLPWLARPAAAIAAALALLTVFAGSAFLGVRALRQQARAVRERADFLTVVTHELKTPLASIRLLAEMLLESRVPPERTGEYFGLLAGEAARLSMLIENVLDLGRLERGERAYDRRECDLADLAREAVAMCGPLAERDGLTLELRQGTPHATVLADRDALLQALLNVLDNARKYATVGRRIEFVSAVRGSELQLSVRDFGGGVPEGERDAIFDQFARGVAHRHGSVPGVGLGLHLARTIARQHGGDLVCVAPGDGGPGACFTLSLPLNGPLIQEPS